MIPFGEWHHHESEFCYAQEKEDEHACHLAMAFPTPNHQKSCGHEQHLKSESKHCVLCHYEFTKDIESHAFKYSIQLLESECYFLVEFGFPVQLKNDLALNKGPPSSTVS